LGMSRIQVSFFPFRNLVEVDSQRSTPKSAAVECLEAYRHIGAGRRCLRLDNSTHGIWEKVILVIRSVGQVDTTPAFLKLRYRRSVS